MGVVATRAALGLVGTYLVVHFAMLFTLIQIVRIDPVTRRAIPSFVVGIYTLALQIGHVLEWLMAMFVVGCALAFWRRSRLNRRDFFRIAQSIGISHAPLT